MNRASRAVGAILLVAAASTHAAEPETLQGEIAELGQAVDVLEQRYLAPALLEQQYKVAARLSDGQFFFATGDFDRAAMVLLDVVESPGNKRHPGYGDALFFLAESLFHTRNFKAATAYFEQVAVQARPERQQRALGRLLEIALQTGDVDAAKRYLARAAQLLETTPNARLLYAVGKYHYEVGELAQAAVTFSRVPAGTGEWLRAQYFLGVLDVRGDRLAEGIARFRSVVDAPAVQGESSMQVDAAVRDQARLAIARLHYEQGEFDKATDAYTSTPRESKAFDEAMYETVWIAIKKGEYERALRRLEILLISQPDVLRGPDARLLKGKLLMMLERYDDAALAFQEVLFEFGPIQAEMQAIQKRSANDLAAHFNQVIGQNIAEFDLSSFLPARAAEFAGPDVEADRALLLVGDLAAQRRDIDEAERTLARLDVALSADSRIKIFPKLHEGWLRALEVQARITLARGRAVEQAARQVGGSPEYTRLRTARAQAAERFARVPKSATELHARDARVDDEMQRLDQEAFKLGLEIRALEAQLVAIDKYVRDTTASTGELPKDRAARAQVVRELQQSKALKGELDALAEAIQAERIRIGANDYAAQEDARVAKAYREALAAEARWLATNGASVDAELARLDALEQRVKTFRQRAMGLVDDRVAEIRRVLERERGNVVAYNSQLQSYQGETESLGGAIAARSFNAVLERIDAVVLEADVGLIDVAWKQKQDQSGQISKMLARQRAEYEELDRSFKEVTGD
jgi:tetratricopeptide (TPR) repeat protein